jgi:hypothetical protein
MIRIFTLLCTLVPVLSACGLSQSQLDQMNVEISAQISELRGWPLKNPVICRVTDVPHMTRAIRAEMKKDYPGPLLQHKQAFLKMIGALPPNSDIEKDTIRFVQSGVAGFYIPREKTLYVRKDFSNFLRRIILAHELVHAIDDQYLDLQGIMDRIGTNEDAGFAAMAVLEGSAREIEQAYMADEFDRIGFLGGIGVMVELLPMLMIEMVSPWSQSNQMASMPRYYLTTLARYTQGTRFLRYGVKTRQEPIEDLLKQLAKKMPPTSKMILHPDLYWHPDRQIAPTRIQDSAVEKILAKVKLKSIHKDTVGELLCALVTTPGHYGMTLEQMIDDDDMANPWTNKAATGWGSDRFFLIEPAQDSKTFRGIWITTWDKQSDRTEFESAYRQHRFNSMANGQAVTLGPTTTLFTFGLDQKTTEAIAQEISAELKKK